MGNLRYRVAFSGPGGHSYGAFGLANPIHALGRAIARIGDFQVPSEPKTTCSADPAALRSVDASFHRAVDAALEEENARWNNRGKLTVDKKLVGDRPAGRTAETEAIVQAAVPATRALGLQVSLDEGSTDSNIPMGLGIPAVTIDGGGRGTGAHSLGETSDSTASERGTERALLLAIALAKK